MLEGKKGQFERFLFKRGYFFTGRKYTQVYKNQQKESKTIYWRLLIFKATTHLGSCACWINQCLSAA